MLKKVYILFMSLLVPFITKAGVIPQGKRFEFFGIIGFITLSLGSIVVYYFVWKNRKDKMNEAKVRYKIRTVQVTRNGRTYVKSQRIRVEEEKEKKPSVSFKVKAKRA